MDRLQIAGLVAALAGLLVAVYLTVLHYIGVVPGCPVTGPISCDAVLASPYAVIAGTSIPTSAAGILWFAVSAATWVRAAGRVQLAWSALGLATVVYLVFIEIVRIGAICLWCTGAHILVVVLFLITLNTWQREKREKLA
ncbi:MAG TPA: vitamin K epoxide reductase family protein [Candidatus Dormibacteraeota bacterium]|nr:vitamin K epoxide reductase family protein [Candidatus Dormibacteraeota bacterium]